MPSPTHAEIEEHELPCVEAVLARTRALMTGYSQALRAELHLRQRVSMGAKIDDNLTLLVRHPHLSLGFRQVLLGLQGRWQAMGRVHARSGLRVRTRRMVVRARSAGRAAAAAINRP